MKSKNPEYFIQVNLSQGFEGVLLLINNKDYIVAPEKYWNETLIALFLDIKHCIFDWKDNSLTTEETEAQIIENLLIIGFPQLIAVTFWNNIRDSVDFSCTFNLLPEFIGNYRVDSQNLIDQETINFTF